MRSLYTGTARGKAEPVLRLYPEGVVSQSPGSAGDSLRHPGKPTPRLLRRRFPGCARDVSQGGARTAGLTLGSGIQPLRGKNQEKTPAPEPPGLLSACAARSL